MAHGLSGFAGGAVAAAELWCEYAVDPLGIDVAEPRFSWILGSERRGQVQSAYRILVASSADLLRGGVGDKWDSGVVASEASVNVPYAGAALASGERCFWQVRVWDGDGAGSGWSDPACFEMGLLDRGDWGGSWIGAEGDLADLAAPLLCKEFTIEEPVGEARLYLCGLGLYELSINGARVSDQVLDPALTDYRERAPYVTHDVTRCLRRGRNVIELLGRIHRNVTWTMRNALKGFPMDCLHREPLGYNEPASVSSLLYTRRHMPLFWSKWLDDIKAARRPDGSLSDWAPELPGSGREHDAAQAGNYPPLVWYLYQYYGDERILAEHYPAMRAYVDYLGTIAENGLITTGWLGDHMLPGPAPGWEEYVAEETPPPLIWTGYYYRGALVVAQAAEVLERSKDAARYAALAEAIRASFNAAYFDPASANYAAGSQTANGFALALDIVPDGHRGGVLGNLRRAIMETHGGHIHTGHCGTTSVIEALARHGGEESADTLFALATATTYPGWGYMVAQGATTIWECWGAGLGAGAQSARHLAPRRQHDDVGLHRQVLLPLPGGHRRAGIPRPGHHRAGIPGVPDRSPRGRRRDLGAGEHQDWARHGGIELATGCRFTRRASGDTGQQPRHHRHPEGGPARGVGQRTGSGTGPQRRADRFYRRAAWRKREQRAGRTARRLRLLLLPPHRLLIRSMPCGPVGP
ncbi:MAG: alpha-L-rhamnosidase N-terminal domain-containing protein [Spirochaetaceae bacterium]|nr:alpha-L-rhamnosidase N-terminal domain-containing protein [Spirochaetaceae bacterium]